MTKKVSLVASALLLTSTMALAESGSIKEAFKNGTVSGDVTLHTTSLDDSSAAQDTGFTAGTLTLNYETDTFKGFKASVGFKANQELAELNDGDYEGSFKEDALLTTAAVSYANDDFFVSVGRQEIALEWLEDFNESVVAGITAVPDTTIVLGYTDRKVAADEDEMGADFEEVTKDGAYVIDVKNTSVEGLELNPYYYSAPDEVDFYGLKASYANDMFGLVAHYADSNIDSNASVLSSSKDGSILHLEASTELAGLSIAAGYITTDDEGGIGGMSSYGDSIDPTDSIGDQVYAADADTYYASLGYSIAGVDLGLLYSDVEYESTNKEADEIYLTAGYAFTDELSILLEYTDLEVDNVDKDEISATLVYTF